VVLDGCAVSLEFWPCPIWRAVDQIGSVASDWVLPNLATQPGDMLPGEMLLARWLLCESWRPNLATPVDNCRSGDLGEDKDAVEEWV